MSKSMPPNVAEEAEIEAEWDDYVRLFANRDELAVEYASCIAMYDADWRGFKYLNGAILRRWSPAALRYIKEKAWNL